MERICVIGGDVRMDYAAKVLEASGYAVTRTACALQGEQDVVLLPVRASADGVYITGTQICLRDLPHALSADGKIIGGGLPREICGWDMMQNQAFLYDNARLTAEAALMLLGSSTEGELFGADIGVIGMGRIAECLCPLLRAVGARVTVYARRAEALARARAMGAQTVRFSERLPLSSVQHEMICNTVPFVLFDQTLLAQARCDVLLLELASAPGGFDCAAVEALGLRYVNGQGLPGKYAPRAAGELIADYVLGVMKGEIEK